MFVLYAYLTKIEYFVKNSKGERPFFVKSLMC